jgi:phosphatidylserine/phosphatidylglycerophosphate/cardiolipin synthase-like enzyme
LDTKSFFAGALIGVFAILLICGIWMSTQKTQCADLAYPIFSPGSQEEILSLIRSANNSISLEMYVFTNEKVADELALAAQRGVRVRVILESRTNSYNIDKISSALQKGGVELKWASLSYKLTHSKMMIIDGKRVLVGSINFSKAAMNENREAAAVFEGEIVKDYIDVFETDWIEAQEENE